MVCICIVSTFSQWCVAPAKQENRNTAFRLMGIKVSSLTETDSLCVSTWVWHPLLPQLGVGNYFVATQARTTYVRWDWTGLCLTGCHWYTNAPSIQQPGKITSGGPGVFLSSHPTSRLSNHLSVLTVRITTPTPFCFFFKFFLKETDCGYAWKGISKKNISFVVWEKGLLVRQADVHVSCVFVRLCCV